MRAQIFPKDISQPSSKLELKEWIEEKKIKYIKYKGSLCRELSECVSDINSSVDY